MNLESPYENIKESKMVRLSIIKKIENQDANSLGEDGED